MPEKKVEIEKAKTNVVEKPAAKKVAASKATTLPAKPKSTVTTTTKAPVAPKQAAKAAVTKPKTKPAASKQVTKVEKVEKKATPAAPKKDVKVVQARPAPIAEEVKAVAPVVKMPEKTAQKPVVKGKLLDITLVKSGIGYSKRHKATLKALGFRHLNQTIQQVDSPSLRGMLAKVSHLVRIEEQVKK
jgi:large subunit ribosomal protein L30